MFLWIKEEGVKGRGVYHPTKQYSMKGSKAAHNEEGVVPSMVEELGVHFSSIEKHEWFLAYHTPTQDYAWSAWRATG